MLAPNTFESSVTSRVFTYCYTMPRIRDPVEKIQQTTDGFKGVKSPRPGNMW